MEALLAGACPNSPHVTLLPNVGMRLVCLSSLPSACDPITASPPVRADWLQSTASQGRTGGGVSWWGCARRSEAESLDRCAPLRQPHGGSVVKRGQKGLTFDYT